MLIKIAKTGKKVLLSSGMSSWNELDDAVETLQSNGCKDLIVLHCTSEYPCPPDQVGLNTLDELKIRYKDITIGFSDHTMGLAAPLAAVIKGAKVIEKHFTLSKEMYGSDAAHSTEPMEFKKLVDEIRHLEQILNSNIDKDEKAKSLKSMKITFEKSIVASKSIDKFDILEFKDLAFKKPGDGIPAREYKKLIGKKLNKAVDKDYKFEWKDCE
jgi:N,N'-diacetyllegionaminate synthase